MSPEEQLDYFRFRAEVERSLAKEAGDTIAGKFTWS